MAYFIIMPGFIMPLTSRADMSCWCVSFTCICVILTISFSLWLCIMKPQSHWTIFISIMFEGIEATPRLTQAGRPRMIQGLFERSPRRRRLAVGAEVLMRRGDIRNGAGIGLRPGGDDAPRVMLDRKTGWSVVTRLDNGEGIIRASGLRWGLLETFARASRRGCGHK